MYNTLKDTIAAISTGPVEAGIGIVRISGADALKIGKEIFLPAKKIDIFVPRHAYLGKLQDKGSYLDEALFTFFPGPKSYTGEDTVELSCHGGGYLLQRVLETVLNFGARLAEPGEFTRRAFFNGRLELDQAEAVADLIGASNEAALKLSLSQLDGRLSGRIKALREEILKETAYIEAALDDPEHIDLQGYSDILYLKLSELKEQLQKLIDGFQQGRLMKEGIRTVIAGRPNVGKSSLLNALAGMDRAIVSPYPGTTRDTLEELIRLGSFTLRMVDTAGIRNTSDPVESLGVDRAKKEMEKADLAFLVLDAVSGFTKEDEEILKSLSGMKKIIIWNKTDLAEAPSEPEGISISAKTGKNMEQITKNVSDIIFDQKLILSDASIILTNLRHKEAVSEALSALDQVCLTIQNGMPEDLYLPDLLNAYGALGKILGEQVGDDLIDKIFSDFCMGK